MSVERRWIEVQRLIHIVAGDLPHGQEDMEAAVRAYGLAVLDEACEPCINCDDADPEEWETLTHDTGHGWCEGHKALRESLAEKPPFPPPTPRSTEEEKC